MKKILIVFLCVLFTSIDIFANLLHEAVQNKDIDMLMQLIDAGYDVNAEDQETFCTEKDIAWYYCKKFYVLRDEIENIKLYLRKKISKKTALHYAVEMNFIEAIQFLLQAGADIMSKDEFHRTPLDIAVQYNAVQAVEILLPHYILLSGSDLRLLSFSSYGYSTLMHDAAEANFANIIKILVQSGFKVDACLPGKSGFNIFTGAVYGTRPLHLAVKYNAYDAVAVLLQSGANKYCKDKSGKTPQDYAQNDKMKSVLRHFGTTRRK